MPKVVDEREYVNTAITRALLHFMRERKMSARRLGETAGMSGDAVRNILRGRSDSPRESTLRALATALNVSVADIIEDNPDYPPPASGQAPIPFKIGGRDSLDIAVTEYAAAASKSAAASEDVRTLPSLGEWRLPRRLLAELGADPAELALVVAPAGWEPHASRGDRVLVDTAWTRPQPGLWLVWTGWGHVVAEIEPQGGRLLSGGQDATALTLCGRVVAKWSWT